MALFVVVAVRDRAIDAFMQPFFVPHRGGAVRSFLDECNRAESPLHAHPDDYDLYCLGQFNDATALFDLYQTPEMIMTGKTAAQMKE